MTGVSGVVIENLTKRFTPSRGQPVLAVAGVNLVVPPSELLALVGPSGCGKTTLLRLIAGLEEPSSGAISLAGRPMNCVPPQDRDLAMVFQNHALFPHLSLYDNLAFGLRLRNVPRTEADQRVRETAQMLGLTDALGRRPRELSGGQRQRAALGRALVRRPKLLLLDEPLSSLDAPLRHQLRAEIARLQRQLALTLIYVTHDQAEAMALGDRIALMRDGTLCQVAPPLELYQRPADLWTAQFIGSPPINLFRGTLVEQEGTPWFRADPPATLALPLAGSGLARLALGGSPKPVVLGLRPERNIFKSSLIAAVACQPAVEAVVELVQPLGAETHLHLTAGGCSFVLRAPACDPARPHDRLMAHFDLERALLFDPVTGRTL